ncbi:HEAT repeat protein [Hirsutella rhossiliensis]|uniref:HEAT repeat protein n=1 Tax=Hirsutella rhossiliensis TaxID=111463 RepID=A0A9P8MU01_9HYPO|nr:HEAT repeat protein [Hirsutella rhossiliensis]KAH0959172.1 HEAT repeat protein [Hirsutella rhossiliensis]
MDTTPGARDRTALFQKLKPFCVKISQHAIRDPDGPAATQELVEHTSQVLDIIEAQIESNPDALDEKLAEYVFFPLYHIFRQMDRYPVPLIENCIKSLRLLITYGWKSKISAKLVQQIFSLLVFIIDGVPGSQNKREVPEETVLEAFRTQTALLGAAASSAAAAFGLAEQNAIPVLGHGITVMLDGAVDGANPWIQREALRCLRGAYSALREQEALASFLPGTVSSLAKILSLHNRHKTAVLAESLEALRTVLTRVLGDLRTRSILAQGRQEEQDSDGDKSKILSPAWLKATVLQVKLALSTIMKLRTLDAHQIREALERLCVALLDECHTTLSNCTAILVETAIVLDGDAGVANSTQTSLGHLVNIYPTLGETVKTIVYNWMSSLPRVMQTGDDDLKKIAIRNLSKGVDLFRNLGLESATLDDSMSAALKDSMVSLLQASSQQADPGVQLQLHDGTVSVGTSAASKQTFQPLVLARESQKELRGELMGLIDRLGSASQKAKLAASLLETVRESSSVDQTAAVWLCFELIKAADSSITDADTFLDMSLFAGPSDDTESIFGDLYNFAVQVLESRADSTSGEWCSEALSLEVVAYAAHKSGHSFRPELIDVLFPIATYLGSENHALQQHAVAALNSVAASAQYSNVSDLIVDNVDYMVNSVALRLNTLDISPASLQVLLMMIRLAGPRLVPFLDDVVDSIFAALGNYHGYKSFVESLFAVLKEVVDQASRTNQHLLTDRERARVDHRKKPLKEQGLDSLLDFLDKRAEREARDAAEAAGGEPIKGHPHEPWKTEATADEGSDDVQNQPGPGDGDEKPPNSPTYQLLLRIASLTQHYLTSPMPKLRRSLLELLTTASLTLAGDEDSFLPLVNAIWPVVIGRLYDPEAFITIEACNTLVSLCEAAGDFLSSRFKTEWGDGLHAWCRKAQQQALGSLTRSRNFKGGRSHPGVGDKIMIPIRSTDGLEGKETALEPRSLHSGSLGQHSSPARIWEAVVKLLTSIVSFVHVDADMFDQILDLLSDALERNDGVKEALETINADAVWLVRYERGYVDALPTPQLEGVKFAEMERMPRSQG